MESPQLFGSYLLHKRLAVSETSEVFVAQTLGEFARLCVIKRICPELSTLPDFDQRFRRDAALLVRLIHGNVAQVLEVGAVENRPFIAMEHIDGVCVRDLVRDAATKGSIPPEVALYIGLELCEAVSYIFLRRREHGGVGAFDHTHAWPLDAMVSFDGVVKVISPGSVGALRLTERSVFKVLRSPGHVPPEVVLKQQLDARSDVFSLGMVLWELFCGRQLIAGDPEAYVKAVLDGSFEAPIITRKDVPGEVIRAVASMLRLDPAERPVAPEAVRPTLVTSLRRMAPAFGSGAMARVLLGRYAEQIGSAEQMTDALTRKAVTLRTSVQPGNSETLTYGRPEDLERSVAAEATPFKPGDPIQGTRYRMIRLLGRGGGAEVLAAQHVDLDRRVAIKVIAPELATQAAAIAHFRLEARTCSRIGHPNIIDVTDFGELPDGRFFFAMELLEGKNLGEILTEQQRMSPERALPIFRQIAKALQAAHEHGVVHRDLKPENVMIVERDGREDFVKVLDFGVMAFSAEQSVERVGTPGYMAPEQIERDQLTPRTDIYGMGVGLYEVLSGELPWGGESIDAYGEEVLAGPAPALRSRRGASQVHPAIERVVHRALERDPELRHPSAADFEMDLLRAQREAGIATDWDDMPEPEGLRDRRRGATGPEAATDDDELPARKSLVSRMALVAFVAVIAMGLYIVYSTRHGVPPRTTPDSGHPMAARAPDARTVRVSPPAPEPPTVAPPAPTPARATPAPAPTTRQEATRKVRAVGDAPTRARNLATEGRQLLHQRRLFEAAQKFEASLAVNPRSATARRGLANVAFQRGRYDEALTHARRAVVLDGKDVAALLLMGDCYAKLLRREEARRAWDRVLRLDPHNGVAASRMKRSASR